MCVCVCVCVCVRLHVNIYMYIMTPPLRYRRVRGRALRPEGVEESHRDC